VGKSVKQEGQFLQGSTAFDLKQNQRAQVVFRRLPELEQRVVALEKNQAAPEKL
jgi:UDP-3-O-[3-hydroxymyristoyl] glucosamine N-acyltransferase